MHRRVFWGLVIVAGVVLAYRTIRKPAAPTGKTTAPTPTPPKSTAPSSPIAAPPVKPVLAVAHPVPDLSAHTVAPIALHPVGALGSETMVVGTKGVL